MPARVFIHRLALALGRTVGELLEQLTAHELRDWQQFDIQCGLPDVAAQWQRAQSAAIATAAAGSNVSPLELMPVVAWDKKPATAKEIAEVFRGQV